MKRIPSVLLMGAILLAGCDLLNKSDDSEADTYDVRILASDDTVIHTETVVDPPLVNLLEVSTSMEAAFQTNWIVYEGRDLVPYDASDLLLIFYRDDDGGLALLPSISGGGSFVCGFQGAEVVEDFDGVLYATSLQSVHPSAVTELPFRAEWVDCENDYEDVSSEYVDTLIVDPMTSIIPDAQTHTISDVAATGGLSIEVERNSANDSVRPIVVYNDGTHWHARLLEREGGDTFSGVVFSERSTLHLVFLSHPAE